MFEIKNKEGKARTATFTTPHSTVSTPAFQNVATAAAIKGGLSAYDLNDIKCQIMLCNTYHLHLRPGDELVRDLGGLHKFTGWDKTILTDSGGFQVFSLAKLRKIHEEGVYFSSHIDGHKMFMGPEESINIQSNLASTIAMQLDECIPAGSDYDYTKASVLRTQRWLVRCKEEMERLNANSGTLNNKQMLFGINQGCTFRDLRLFHAEEMRKLDLDGYAIGGLAIGEPVEEMYDTIDAVTDILPNDKPRYLMGVGTPGNIIEGVYRGVDLFDCVMPARNARHGHLFTFEGIRNIKNAKYERDELPIDENCGCDTCKRHTRAYLRHLFKADETLGLKLAVTHNLYFYNNLMEMIREAIDNGNYGEFRMKYRDILDKRI